MGTRRGLATLRRVVAIAVVVAVVACTSPSEDPAPRDESDAEASVPGTGTGDETRVSPATEDADVIAAVTSAGIRIVAADGSTAHPAAAPATGVELSEDELSSLLTAARDGAGTLGSTLDDIGPAPIPPSAFLAGYALGVDTPAAALAGELLGAQDLMRPADVVFPALVLTLFASDMAHATGDQNAESLALSSYGSGDESCSEVTKAIYRGINAVFDAIHINYVDLPKTGIAFVDGLLQGMANLVVDGINIVIEAGRTLVIGVARFLIDEVLSVVAKVAALAAMIGNFVGYIEPVHATVVFDPATASKGTPGQPVHVRATTTAAVNVGTNQADADWPGWFKDCAKVAGVTLEPLKPVGEHVDWTIDAPGLLAGQPGGKRDDVLVDGGPGKAVGMWDLVTATEPANAQGDLVTSTARLTVTIERAKVKAIIESLGPLATELIGGHLPGFVKKYLSTAINGAVGELTGGFVKLMFPTGSKQIEISYHDNGKPKPKKHHETWDGSWTNPGYGSSGTFHLEVTRTDVTMAGSLQVFGADCLSSGHLVADVNGDHVTFGLVSGGIDTISFSGEVSGRHVAGTWAAGAACGAWTGPWEATITPAQK